MAPLLLLSRDSIEENYGALIELRPSVDRRLDRDVIQMCLERRTLWTLVNGPCGPLLTSGCHYVNRLAYFSSERPVPEGIIVDEAPDAALVSCEGCCTWWDSDLYDECPYCEDEKAFPHGHVDA